MKTYLISLLKVVLVFFAPIAPLIFLVALSTIFDTGFGMWRSSKLGIKISSKTFRHGLVPKLLSYVGAVIVVYLSDFFLLNDLVHLVVDIDYLSTKMIALVLLSIKVKSIDESFEAVKGYSFLKKATNIILRAKNIKKGLNE